MSVTPRIIEYYLARSASKGLKPILFAFLSILSATSASGQRLNADTLEPAAVLSGSTATQEHCKTLPDAVWVTVEKQGDCIRYYDYGLLGENAIALIVFHGDILKRNRSAGEWTNHEMRAYRDNNPIILRARMQGIWQQFGVPSIFFARPGTYGSSGDHKVRRSRREVAVVNAALDEIKRTHNIKLLSIAGQSGGGHMVGALLSLRDDIRCAVIASGVVSVRQRMQIKGWSSDATGLRQFFDPIDHVLKIRKVEGMRIFIVGDPKDTNVPFTTQERFYMALKTRGLDAHLLKVLAVGPERHGLDHVLPRLGSSCAKDVASDVIRAMYSPAE